MPAPVRHHSRRAQYFDLSPKHDKHKRVAPDEPAPVIEHFAPAPEKILYLEASKKKVQITDKLLDGIFLGAKEGSELVVWYAELSKDGLVNTQQIQSFSTTSVGHP